MIACPCGKTIVDPCAVEMIEAVRTRAETAELALTEARATIKRLNRRCQSAEAGLAARLTSGVNLGRALANAAAGMYLAQRDDARKATEAALNALVEVWAEVHAEHGERGYVSIHACETAPCPTLRTAWKKAAPPPVAGLPPEADSSTGDSPRAD